MAYNGWDDNSQKKITTCYQLGGTETPLIVEGVFVATKRGQKNGGITMTEETKSTAGAEENQQGQTEPEVITMTKEDYEKTLQTEADKRVTDAIKTSRSKWEKEYAVKIEKERADAERLARLSSDEREKELLSRKEEEINSKEKLLRKRELKLAAIDILAEEKLPVAFADQLLGEDADETHDRIKKFKQAWHDAIDAEVKERLKGVIPQSGSKQQEKPDVNAIIRKMAKK